MQICLKAYAEYACAPNKPALKTALILQDQLNICLTEKEVLSRQIFVRKLRYDADPNKVR